MAGSRSRRPDPSPWTTRPRSSGQVRSILRRRFASTASTARLERPAKVAACLPLGYIAWRLARRPSSSHPNQSKLAATSARVGRRTYRGTAAARASQWNTEALQLFRKGEFENAELVLQRLQDFSTDLPVLLRLKVSFERACLASRQAEDLPKEGRDQEEALSRSLYHLTAWLELGLGGGWQAIGQTSNNQIYGMGCDGDLRFVLAKRPWHIIAAIPEPLRSALPNALPSRTSRSGGGGGCVPSGTPVETASGPVAVENLRAGDQVLVLQPDSDPQWALARVSQVHTSREPECFRLNRKSLFTPDHLLYTSGGEWVQAGAVTVGVSLAAMGANEMVVTHVDSIRGYFHVYDLTIDHPSHTYMANGLVCHNKHP